MPQSFGPGGAIHGDAVVLVPSAVRTASGSGGTYVMESRSTLRLALAVTAASGTSPNLAVTVENSGDGSTWYSAGTFAAKTGTGTERKSFSGIDRFVRVSWAITGTTPSFTFEVAGEAVGG